MPIVSTITIADGQVYRIKAAPDRTLLGISVPAMQQPNSYLAFVNSPDDARGYPLTEDGQTILSPLSGSQPQKEHLLKAFGETVVVDLLMEFQGEKRDGLSEA